MSEERNKVKVEICETCRHVRTKLRTRSHKSDGTKKKVPVYYCFLSGAEVLSVQKACSFYNKTVEMEQGRMELTEKPAPFLNT